MEKRKIAKIILGIVLIILLIFIIFTMRKFIILRGLQKSMQQYVLSKNYHVKSIAKEEERTVIAESYVKDDRGLTIVEKFSDEEYTKISFYDNGERVDMFIDTTEKKLVKLNTETAVAYGIVNYLQTDNVWQTFIASITTSIKKDKVNEKDCYVINNFMSPVALNGNYKNEYYIEKDTGICIKSIIDDVTIEREYDFNNVSDKMFIEPDISAYSIIENE